MIAAVFRGMSRISVALHPLSRTELSRLRKMAKKLKPSFHTS